MALRFIDGFDHYGTSYVLSKYISFTGSGYSIYSPGRFGGSCIKFNSTNLGTVRKTFDNQQLWIVGFAFKFENLNSVSNYSTLLVSFSDTLNNQQIQCSFGINVSSQLVAWRNGRDGTVLGTSSNTFAANTWYYFEGKAYIDPTVGYMIAQINGVNWINATNVNTRVSTSSSAGIIDMGQYSGRNNANGYMDDLYVCDGTGSVNKDFLGECRIETLLPSGAGSNTTWTPSSNSNYSCVNEPSFNADTSYISTTNVNSVDTYSLSTLSSNPAKILGIQSVIAPRKLDAGVRKIAPVVISGGTTTIAGTDNGVYDNYIFNSSIIENDPATSTTWAATGINTMEAGVKLTM